MPLGGGALLGGPNTAVLSVAQLIAGAFRLLGVLAAEEVPTDAEQANAFDALNDMLDSWGNERLTLFATSRDTYTLIPNHNPHTIGLGGDFNVTRPVRIDRASLVLASSANTELPLEILSDAQWQITQGKNTTGKPVYLWPETKYALINLWLNPVPVVPDFLVLYTWQQLGRFSATTVSVDFPPGYARAFRYNLAKELAPEYGVSLSKEADDIATESKAILKRINTKPVTMRSDGAVLRPGRFNVIAGDKG